MVDYKNNIRVIAKQKGITQQQIADALGVSLSSVKTTLQSEKSMQIDTLQRYADALGVSLTDLLTGETTQKENTLRCPVCGAELELTRKEM